MNPIDYLESLCGEHYLSGVELTRETVVDEWDEEEECQVILFTLDNVTYRLVENPLDGYRSRCREITIPTAKNPAYRFPPVRVLCYMVESEYYKNECIVMRDISNGKILLEAGTLRADDYYPIFHFRWIPENMGCNEGK